MKVSLHHLTGSLRGRTQYFDTNSITFGIGENCAVRFDAGRDTTVCPVHAELTVENHTPMLRDRSGQNAVSINGRLIIEAALKDGDLIQFGDTGPLMRFRMLPEGARGTKPWRYIVADSRDIVVRTPHRRYMSPLYLGQHLLTEVARYGSPTAKIMAVLVTLVPILIIIMLGVNLYQQSMVAGLSERRIAELVSQLETGRLTRAELEQRVGRERQTVADLRREQEELRKKLRASLREQEATRRSEEELDAMRRQLSALASAQRFAEEVIGRFEKGVGLLQGGYRLIDKQSGRPLRYGGFDEQGNPLVDEEGNAVVTLEGSTPPVVLFYAGTGFLIDKRGTILTNRHLVRMWEGYEPVQEALRSGFEPDLILLRIFLPGAPRPYNLELLGISDHADLAVLRTDRPPAGLPTLRLAAAEQRVRVGEPIIVLSYPATFDGLLSRLPAAVSSDVLRDAGPDPPTLAEALSRRGLIRPLATQGHVSDLSLEVITYEARSAGGSSGGPVLNRAGRVIAVNHSLLLRVEGVNLGLPVRFVEELLGRLKVPVQAR